MAHLETFSTLALDTRRRMDQWGAPACAVPAPGSTTEPAEPCGFHDHIARTPVGDLVAGEICFDTHSNLQALAPFSRPRRVMFFVHLQLEGESVTRQQGRAAHLRSGDFTLCDIARPWEINLAGPGRLFVLGIPEALLRRYLTFPEGALAVSMSGATGMSGLLSSFLYQFWAQFRRGIEPGAAARVSHAILDLVASAYTALPHAPVDRSSLAMTHRIRIVNYIEAHLGEPDLTPMRVAQACKMTPRYLHHLFSRESETVSRYILRRRLEECSRALAESGQRGRTVTSIAFDYGFNSPTHFGRAFRARYGVTPRAWRRQHTAASRPAELAGRDL